MKTVSAGTSARRQRASLAPGAPRSPACPSLLLLLLLLELAGESATESPWALPVVADRPASLAKVVMAELANLKPENKSWPGGTHSLHYHYLTLSEPGPGLPRFLAVGYVDDQPFLRYDSRVGRAEPQAPWMASLDTQYWETETQKHRAWAEVQQVNLWTVMSYYNQSGGIHSAQRMFGCDIQEDSLSSNFWHFGFDGQDHLSLDSETLSWVSAEPVAMQTKRLWDSERCYAEYDKAYLESLCLTSLHRYLELGSQILTRREPPTVHVTRHTTQDRSATLRCWALGFYPQDISLSWWLGEQELALETEYVETRPSGDGTYQTWAAVQVPAGQEAAYTCRVQHSGLNHVLTVAWEPPSSQGLIAMVTCALFLLAVVVVILTRRYLQGRNTEPYEQAPGGEEPI
ncbi:BOLA class I histocompatibility antigen, alpha chain BL3-7 [Desmodus rotundus]|uniref:BOLA class I histocompatibility antigen, alpha chain BL3-7 n=1 Tax=Desmodus rotundus TaxID=9430 RepID=UPI002380EEAD|nr:BOLA class I histocompatibility antigen, alpha chain BL3-7-like isoform X2 [Desmodus rotundus]XP_053769325.1 BOLA class I histocompatibility antigen, alpha chain BL3-7 [Desmodus rotundus]